MLFTFVTRLLATWFVVFGTSSNVCSAFSAAFSIFSMPEYDHSGTKPAIYFHVKRPNLYLENEYYKYALNFIWKIFSFYYIAL